MRKKIHFVTSIPSPYQLDFFRALEAIKPGSFTVTFCAAQESDRQYYSVPDDFGFNAQILNHKIRRFGKDFHSNAELVDVLRKQPAVNYILGGNYFMPDARTVRGYCMRTRSRWFFWGENPFKKEEVGAKRWLKKCYLRWFLRPATGVIGIGKIATDAYGRFSGGRPSANIPYAPYLGSLLNPSDETSRRAGKLREDFGNSTLILYVGSLIERKDPFTLLRAFARIVAAGQDCRLLLAGEGPLRNQLESFVADEMLQDRVSFLGFLRGEKLQAIYKTADLFVLPTAGHEGWGVVVQEAMAAGLPLIASRRVGAAVEMLAGGREGMLFDHFDVEGLSNCIQELHTNPDLRANMSRRGKEVARATGAESAAQQLIKFLDI